MKTLLNVLLVAAVLLGVVLLVYRRRLGDLWIDIRNLFSNRFVAIGLPVFILVVIGIFYWMSRDQGPPPAPFHPVRRRVFPLPHPPTQGPPGAALQDVSALYRKIGRPSVAIFTYNDDARTSAGKAVSSTAPAVRSSPTCTSLRGAHSAQIKTSGGKYTPSRPTPNSPGRAG